MGFLTPNAGGEHDVLSTFVLQQLAQLRTTVHGLSDEQARATPSASALNLTGLLLHAAETAVVWSARAASAPDEPVLPDGVEDHYLDVLCADARPLAEVLAFFDRCAELTRDNLASATDLTAKVTAPEAPWFPKGLAWESRWVVALLATELARHAGHADIIRESIDGKGSYELNDLADAEG